MKKILFTMFVAMFAVVNINVQSASKTHPRLLAIAV